MSVQVPPRCWHLTVAPGVRAGTAGLLDVCPTEWAGGHGCCLPSLTAPALQVQSYMDHHCSNSTDRRILLMFLDICAELSKICQRFEALHAGTPVTNNFLDKCKALVSQSNDLSSLRAK